MNNIKSLLIIPLLFTCSLHGMDDAQDDKLGAGQIAPIKVIAPTAAKTQPCAPVARKDTPVPSAPASESDSNPSNSTRKYNEGYLDLGLFEFATGLIISKDLLPHRAQSSNADIALVNHLYSSSAQSSDHARSIDIKQKSKKKSNARDLPAKRASSGPSYPESDSEDVTR